MGAESGFNYFDGIRAVNTAEVIAFNRPVGGTADPVEPESRGVWNKRRLRKEFMRFNEDLVRAIEGSPMSVVPRGNSDFDRTLVEGHTTFGLGKRDAAGGRVVRIAHFTELSKGGIDTHAIEVFTIAPDGRLSIKVEIMSTGFDGVANWSREIPTNGKFDELAKSDIRRMRSLVMMVSQGGKP